MPWHPPGGLLAVPPLPLILLLGYALGTSLSGEIGFVAYFIVSEILALFGSASETALERHSRSGVLDRAEAAGKREDVEVRLTRAPDYELTAKLARFLGNAMVVVGVAFVAFQDVLGGAEIAGLLPWSTLAAVLLISFVVTFLVNDVLVRLLIQRDPDRHLLNALPTLEFMRLLLAPLRFALVWIVRLVFRVRLDAAAPSAREEILETVEEGEREGSFTSEEADMIESIIELDQSTASDVLTPRADMIMIQADASLLDAARLVSEEGYSRIPVYGKDRDDVIGLLYAHDLLSHFGPHVNGSEEKEQLPVSSIMREPFFVPESKPLRDLLGEMRARKMHLAIVLDEFNGTVGLVTIEDLLEEIVGEIQDEYDDEESPAAPTPEEIAAGTMQVEGRTPIEDVNRALEVDLPVDENFETMGGLVFNQLGKVPTAGDQVHVGDVALTVLEADERTVKRLKVDVPASG